MSQIARTTCSSCVQAAVALPASSAVNSSVALRRGASQGLDLTRVSIRLDGLQQYGVAAAFIMGLVMESFFLAPKEKTDNRKQQFARRVHALSSIVSMIAATYSVCVFSLIGLYGKGE